MGLSTDVAPMNDSKASPASRRERIRTGMAFALGALTVLFAVVNLDEVEVSWIVGTWQTPLIVVILVSVLLGAALGWILARRRRTKESR